MPNAPDPSDEADNEAASSIKQAPGKVVGDKEVQTERKVQALKGKAQKAVGDVKNAVKSATDENF